MKIFFRKLEKLFDIMPLVDKAAAGGPSEAGYTPQGNHRQTQEAKGTLSALRTEIVRKNKKYFRTY